MEKLFSLVAQICILCSIGPPSAVTFLINFVRCRIISIIRFLFPQPNHVLFQWLKKTHRNPLYKAMEKMKEGIHYHQICALCCVFSWLVLLACHETKTELGRLNYLFAAEMMLLGFISLLLAATSRIISGICIDSKYYNSRFSPCTKEEVQESINAEHAIAHARKHLLEVILHHSPRRNLKTSYHNHEGCREVCKCFNLQIELSQIVEG